MELDEKNRIEEAYKDFIIKKKHPCIMANAVFATDNYHVKIYGRLDSPDNIPCILTDIQNYVDHYDFNSNQFESLIFCFKDEEIATEEVFEAKLWTFLQALHNKDVKRWDDSVSPNPDDSNFSFSLAGRAFYVIGMHPQSSRLARRTPYCTVVFNLHWQFEKLREMGTYQTVKKRIRQRDKRLQGSINPTLRDFGKDTEAKQYSGREVEKDWKCPFHNKHLES